MDTQRSVWLQMMQSYEVRFLDVQHLRQVYIPLIHQLFEDWKAYHLINQQEVESAFDWAITEAIERTLNKRVEGHYRYDTGKCVYDVLTPDPKLLLTQVLDPTRFVERKENLKHVKVMIIGHLLIVAALF